MPDETVKVTVANCTHPVTLPALDEVIVQLSWFTEFEPTTGVVNDGADMDAPVRTDEL